MKIYTIVLNNIPGSDSELARVHDSLAQEDCQCAAHAALNTAQGTFLSKMIDIPKPLNDDWGKKLATTLLSQILKHSGMEEYVIEDCNQGTPHAVNFILQLPSGESTQFTGWPDFTVTRSFPAAARRVARRVQRLSSVGDVQSPPGNDARSKTLTIAQAGIYGIGTHLHRNVDAMPVIILFKDKTAQVLCTRCKPSQNPLENSVGEIEYNYVEKLDSSDLTNQNELQEFSKHVVSVIKATQK